MNDWQLLREAQRKIRTLTWVGGTRFFAPENVNITTLVIENYIEIVRTSTPFCTIRLINTTPDTIQKDLGVTTIEISICTSVQGDQTGEMALMGITLPGVGSLNKGVASFEPLFLEEMQKVQEQQGVKFKLEGSSYGDLQFINNTENISFRQYTFTADSTSFKTYIEPSRFRSTIGGFAPASASTSWVEPVQFGYTKVILKFNGFTLLDGTGTSGPLQSGIPAGSHTYTLQAFYDDKSSDITPAQESIIIEKNFTVV